MDYKKNKIYRVLPQDIEAEEAVISAMLIGSSLSLDAINNVIDLLLPEDFYKNSNRIIFTTIVELSSREEPIDLVTVANSLEKNDLMEKVGGIVAIARLVETIPIAANLKHYIKIIKRNSILRKMIMMSNDIADICFEPGQDAKKVIEYAEKNILEISKIGNQESITSIRDAVKRSINIFEKHSTSELLFTGIQTGFDKIDDLTSGLQKSDLIIIAARPAMGKTSFALNIARNAAKIDNRTVIVFSLEMSVEQLVMRMLCSEARISASKIRRGYSNKEDWDKIIGAVGQLSKLSIYIDDSPDITVSSIRSKTRRFKKNNKLDLIIIDYLQLMKGNTAFTRRDLEISDISRSLKILAKELNIPVVALSQLNRKLEDRPNKRPQLADLRESGALEQDADVVMFIYRDEVYNSDLNNQNKGDAEIIISKQRNGPTGEVTLTFINSYTRFENFTHYRT